MGQAEPDDAGAGGVAGGQPEICFFRFVKGEGFGGEAAVADFRLGHEAVVAGGGVEGGFRGLELGEAVDDGGEGVGEG